MSTIFPRGNATVESNLTPMIDVTFLLIVFFVLVSQIVEGESVPMNLPEPMEPVTELAGDEQRAVINIVPGSRGHADGYRLAGVTHPVGPAGIEALTAQLVGLFAANPQIAINLRADRLTRYEFVEPVMQAVSTAASRVPDQQVAPRVNLVVVREDR
jgi:biopolymer transport protein ExbD